MGKHVLGLVFTFPYQVDQTFQSWTKLVDKVVKREVEQAKDVACRATKELRLSLEGEGEKHTILQICFNQVKDIMNCTEDLVECVNNDIKKEILGNLGKLTACDKID